MMRDLLHEAFGAMKHNRRRTALTMLGMAWGIATVVLLMAYGGGFDTAIHHIFETWGVKVIGVFPGRTSMQAGGMKSGTLIRFTMDDVEHITSTVPMVKHITPSWNKDVKLQVGDRSLDTWAQGGNPVLQIIRNITAADGRFFTEEENIQHARVAVIGLDAKNLLFSGQPAVGEYIRVDGISFQVIGVIQPKPQEGDNNVNKGIYIPSLAMSNLRDIYYVDGIWFDYEGMEYERIEQAMPGVLADGHSFRPDDRRAVFVYNGMKRLRQFEIITSGLKILLGFVGTIPLGIGVAGLMNIMLV